jgi:outer membrane biosynthesis protein TonB
LIKRMKKQSKYKVNDFLRYLKGEMTNSERNSFEKESQRDPFAEEALEGLETVPGIADEDLKNLQSRLNRRTRRNRKMTVYRIAASIAVLMIISSVFIVVEKTNSTRQEPMPEYRSVTMDIAKSEPVYAPEVKKKEVEAKVKSSEKYIPANNKETTQEITTAKQEEEPAKKEEVQSTKKDVSIAVRSLPEGDQIALEAMPENRKAAVAGSRTRTDSAVPAAYSAGALSGYIPPQPVAGTEAFNKYITENLVRPDSATSGQRVVVVTSFKVLSDGTIDSVKIIRSPGKEFSDEAIRLIRSGPLWKPAMRDGVAVEDEVRLRIVFP